jgi:ankyrin repeat protein
MSVVMSVAFHLQTFHQLHRGYTLLHLAVVEGRTWEVALLLHRGANTNVKDKEYVSDSASVYAVCVCVCARARVCVFVFYIWISHFDARVVSYSGTTPLHWACHRGLVVIAGMLLDMRADINSKDKGFECLFNFRMCDMRFSNLRRQWQYTVAFGFLARSC